MGDLLTPCSDTLVFCTLPRMKMITCGSEAGWSPAGWPQGLLSRVRCEMGGSPNLCFTDGSSEVVILLQNS